ncbi:MAG: hypothetical protein KGL39_09685 [Patescibacteria group bacterium]|nr:hypothetical protein [Patescibacteria group bacterium]
MSEDHRTSNKGSLLEYLRARDPQRHPDCHEAAQLLEDVERLLGRLAECFGDDETEFSAIAAMRRRLNCEPSSDETTADSRLSDIIATAHGMLCLGGELCPAGKRVKDYLERTAQKADGERS